MKKKIRGNNLKKVFPNRYQYNLWEVIGEIHSFLKGTSDIDKLEEKLDWLKKKLDWWEYEVNSDKDTEQIETDLKGMGHQVLKMYDKKYPKEKKFDSFKEIFDFLDHEESFNYEPDSFYDKVDGLRVALTNLNESLLERGDAKLAQQLRNISKSKFGIDIS